MSTFTNFRWSDARNPYRIRATKSIEYINWDALKDVAAGHRSIGCTLGQQYGFGGRHVVFQDYVHWIARVGIPPVDHNDGEKYESSCISRDDRGPFRLVHGDFGDNNMLVDEKSNLLSVIDWEKSFVGPAEMAASFPLRLLVYTEALVPTQRDEDGKVMGTWKATLDDRENMCPQFRLRSVGKLNHCTRVCLTIAHKKMSYS